MIALRRQRLLAVGGTAIQVFEANQGRIEEVSSLSFDLRMYIERILGWDGERAYLSVLIPKDNGEEDSTALVWVLGGEPLAEIARYELNGEVLSMNTVGQNLVFATQTSISVAAPLCVP